MLFYVMVSALLWVFGDVFGFGEHLAEKHLVCSPVCVRVCVLSVEGVS